MKKTITLTDRAVKEFDPKLQISSDNYRKNITLLSIIASLLAGAVSYLSGILSGPIGISLGFQPGDLSFIALINVALIIGNFCGAASISYAIRKWTTRGSIVIASVIALIASLALALDGVLLVSPNASRSSLIAAGVIFGVCVFLSGFAFGNLNNCGIFLMIGIYRVHKCEDKWINITQGTFGVFVALFGFLSGAILSVLGNYSWYIVYFIIAAISLGLVAVSYLLKTGETPQNIITFTTGGNVDHDKAQNKKAVNVTKNPKKARHITIGVILAAFALWFYMMTENTGTFWLGSYIQNQPLFNNNSDGASALSAYAIAMFWTGATFGRLVFRSLFPRAKDVPLMLLFCALVVTSYIFLSMSYVSNTNKAGFYSIVLIAALCVGLSLSLLYPSILNYGIKQSKTPSPLNQAVIADLGITGAALANVIFYLVADGFKGSIGNAAAYALPVFYACGTITIAAVLIISAFLWRTRSSEGKAITLHKGSAGDNLSIEDKYGFWKKEFAK